MSSAAEETLASSPYTPRRRNALRAALALAVGLGVLGSILRPSDIRLGGLPAMILILVWLDSFFLGGPKGHRVFYATVLACVVSSISFFFAMVGTKDLVVSMMGVGLGYLLSLGVVFGTAYLAFDALVLNRLDPRA